MINKVYKLSEENQLNHIILSSLKTSSEEMTLNHQNYCSSHTTTQPLKHPTHTPPPNHSHTTTHTPPPTTTNFLTPCRQDSGWVLVCHQNITKLFVVTLAIINLFIVTLPICLWKHYKSVYCNITNLFIVT